MRMTKLSQFVLAVSLISISVSSCEKEPITSIDNDQANINLTESIEMFHFESNEAMTEKIMAINNAFNKEDAIAGKKFNDKIRLLDDKGPDLSKEGIELLKEYHKDRLEIIYNLRNELGFVSIQSVVDEMNSLILINPRKAEELQRTYKSIISKGDFGYQSASDPFTSLVINTDGFLQLGEKIIKYDNEFKKTILDGDLEKISLLDEVLVSSEKLNIEVSANPKNNSRYYDLKEDIFASYQHSAFRNTWHVGITDNGLSFMQVGSFFNYPGTPVLYPSTLSSINNSELSIQGPNSTLRQFVGYFHGSNNNQPVLTIFSNGFYQPLFNWGSRIRSMRFSYNSHLTINSSITLHNGETLSENW